MDKRHGYKYCSVSCGKKNLKNRIENLRKKNSKGYKEGKHKTHCRVCNAFFIKKTAHHKVCSYTCRKKLQDDIKNLRNGGENSRLKLRFEIFKRDNFTCQYCGRNVKEDKIKLHCDHIHPKKKGGKFKAENLITSCQECNLGKRDVFLTEIILI